MAQAARLNLRMQKELKLLMTDPPPGVSIPLLSDIDDSSSLSLSTIEARIEGPEGTVYSKGVFIIRIQIPERYPFHPPTVTFVTPIYHPNIDTGGRICLDILNMPPKGAWQPSLNISTILTSIGLLLSEPNPDDGLMAETSREYKYNRQAFDQKARAWTEKYANGKDIGRSNSCCSSDKVPNLELDVEFKKEDIDGTCNIMDSSRKKLRLSGEKLSLKSKLPDDTDNKEKINTVTNRRLSISGITQKTTVVLDNPLSSMISEQCKSNIKNDEPEVDNIKEIESIIVSDSEESDEDDKPRMSRFSLLRKKMVGKSL